MPVSSWRAEGTIHRCQGKLRSTCLVPPGMERWLVLVSRRLQLSPPPGQHSQSDEKDVERAHLLKPCGTPGCPWHSTRGSCSPPGSPSWGGGRGGQSRLYLPCRPRFSSAARLHTGTQLHNSIFSGNWNSSSGRISLFLVSM